MTLSPLLQHYRALQNEMQDGRWRLPHMETVGLTVTGEDHPSAEAAWQALCQARPRLGWVQFQSRQLLYTDGPPDPEPAWGRLLAAEVVVDEHTSLRIHYNASRWHGLRYTHHPDGDELLCDRVHHLIHAHPGRLVHRRYWRLDPEQGPIQIAAVLAGVEDAKED